MSNYDEAQQMISDCIKRESKLTEWEQGFIDSVDKQLSERALSEKQIETLDRIWERIT